MYHAYNKEEKAKYDDVYDNTFKQINDGEMITGYCSRHYQN